MSVARTMEVMWLRRFPHDEQAAVRLICFPHAGGSASYYFPLARSLQADAVVSAVQYPGREDRYAEPPIDDLSRLADEIAPQLRDELDRPTVFFGHSMGAVVAFEVIRRLESDGLGPVALIASGRRAPSRWRDESVHLRDDGGLLGEVRRLGGTSTALLADSDVRRMVLPAIRNDYRAIETYVCPAAAVIGCPITVFVGESDDRVSLAEAWAWERHSAAEVGVRVFPGGHFYLSEHREQVVAALRDALNTHILKG